MATKFVLDCSVTSAWCLDNQRTSFTVAVLHAAVSGSEIANAPSLFSEIRNAVLVDVRRKRISETRASEFLKSLTILPIRLIDRLSHDQIYIMASEYNLSFYEASYFYLALREHLPLATLDQALLCPEEQAGVALFQT